MDQGTELLIEVSISSGTTARFKAVVAWSRWVPPSLRNILKMGFGVRITEPDPNWETLFSAQ